MGKTMRIAVSADDARGLESVVSPHFGRCPHFVLVDVEGQEVSSTDVVENPFYGSHQPGQVPGFISQYDVDVMLTGGMGRRAVAFFEQFGIEAVTGASGSVRHSLQRYLGGALEGAQPCRESMEHAGIEEGVTDEGASDDLEVEEDEMGRLREETEMLQGQLAQVTERLQALSRKE